MEQIGRRMITDFFNSTGLVEKITTTQTGGGGVRRIHTMRIASVPCRLSTKTAKEVDEQGRIMVKERHRLYCEATTTNKTIIESDRVTVSDRQFEVVGIANPGMLDHHLQIDLESIR